MPDNKMMTCLWFDNNAEEAVDFYCSVFKDAKKGSISYYGDAGPMPKGQVMMVRFRMNGQEFFALNGGPVFKLTPAISLAAICEDQQEIDQTWEKLLAGGGREIECGWLTDRFGLSWQVVPREMMDLHDKGDQRRSDQMMKAMMSGMKKLDLAKLKAAYYA